MKSKYEALEGNLFGFEIFEEVIDVINKRIVEIANQDEKWKIGLASAEAAVRRLREDYYNKYSKSIPKHD